MVNRIDKRQIDPWNVTPKNASEETQERIKREITAITKQVYRHLWEPSGTTLDIRRLERDLLVLLHRGAFDSDPTSKIAAKFLIERLIESILPDRPVPGEGRGCMLAVSKIMGEAIIGLCVRYGYPVDEEAVSYARARARAEVLEYFHDYDYEDYDEDEEEEEGESDGDTVRGDVEMKDVSERERYDQYSRELQNNSSQPQSSGSQQQETRAREFNAPSPEPVPTTSNQFPEEPGVMHFRRSAMAPRNMNFASPSPPATSGNIFNARSTSPAAAPRGNTSNNSPILPASTTRRSPFNATSASSPAPTTRRDIFNTPLTPIIEQRKAEELERAEYVKRRQEARELLKAQDKQAQNKKTPREKKHPFVESGSDEEPEYLFSVQRSPQRAKAKLGPKRKDIREIRGILKNGGKSFEKMSGGLVDPGLPRQGRGARRERHEDQGS